VPSSNVGQDARHPGVLQGFPQSLHASVSMVLELGHNPFLPNIFQFIIYSAVQCYIFWDHKNVPQLITHHIMYIYTLWL